jgi:hypothetical protein
VVQAADDSRRGIQATDGIWYADYPSASDFFDLFFRCSAFRLADPAATRNGSFYCNPAADQLMNQADSQQATDPAQAAVTWAAVDRAVTYGTPWVTLANLNNIDFLSARVTNYQYNPVPGRAAGPVADTPRACPALTARAATIHRATRAIPAPPHPHAAGSADGQAAPRTADCGSSRVK